jgi:hypothetical protein
MCLHSRRKRSPFWDHRRWRCSTKWWKVQMSFRQSMSTCRFRCVVWWKLGGLMTRLSRRRTSTIASPFVSDIRNINELSTSFVSPSSEDSDLTGPEHSRFNKPYSYTLEGISPLQEEDNFSGGTDCVLPEIIYAQEKYIFSYLFFKRSTCLPSSWIIHTIGPSTEVILLL